MNFRPGSRARHYATPGLRAIPTHDSDLARRPPATTPPPANPRKAKPTARYQVPSKPPHQQRGTDVQSRPPTQGTDSEACTCKGRPLSYAALHAAQQNTVPSTVRSQTSTFDSFHRTQTTTPAAWRRRPAGPVGSLLTGPGPVPGHPVVLPIRPQLTAPPLSRTTVVYSRREQCAADLD